MSNKKRKKKTKNYYFTKEHEKAILDYVSTKDPDLRQQLYIDFIGPAFEEMINKIVYTFKFTIIPNIDQLKQDCLLDLVTLLDKFDVERGYKAFSYYSVITKNWFIAKTKEMNKKNYIENYGDLTVATPPQFDEYLIDNTSVEELLIKEEFFNALYHEMESWLESNDLKEREKQTTKAIMVLLKSAGELPLYQKTAVNSYLRELTYLKTTKQLTLSRKKLIKKYEIFKEKWINGEI